MTRQIVDLDKLAEAQAAADAAMEAATLAALLIRQRHNVGRAAARQHASMEG